MKGEVDQSKFDVLSLISDLCQVVRYCRQDAVFCENVTFSQFIILDQVAKKGYLKMSELHQILAVDKSTTTRLVSPLVRDGLIGREKSGHDSRAMILRLTPEGKEAYRKVWLCLDNFVNAIRKGIPEEKREEVYKAVKIFIGAVKNASSACPCYEQLTSIKE